MLRRTVLLAVAFLGAAAGAAALVGRAEDPPLPAGARLRIGTLHPSTSVLAIGFATGGKKLVAVDERGVVVQDVETGRVERNVRFEFPLDRYAITSPTLSPDLKSVAVVKKHDILIIDLETGWIGKTLTQPTERYLSRLAFSPDGKRLAGLSSNEIVVFDLAEEAEPQTIWLKGFSNQLAFSPDGRTIWVTHGFDSRVDEVDLATGKTKPHAIGSSFSTAVFTKDCKRIAVKDRAGAVRVVDLASGACPLSLPPAERFGNGLAFSPDGGTLVHGSKLVDIATGRELWTARSHAGRLTDFVFSPGGSRLAVGGTEGLVCVFDVVGRAELPRPAEHAWRDHSRERVLDVAFEPSGAIVTLQTMQHVCRWDPGTAALIGSSSAPITSSMFVGLSQQGTAVVMSGTGWWTAGSDGATRTVLEWNERVRSVPSPDGKRLVAALSTSVWLVDTESLEILRSEAYAVPTLAALAVAPDGKTFAASAGDRKAPGLLLLGVDRHADRSFQGLGSEVAALAFSPDGKVLASADSTELRLWSTASGKLAHKIALPRASFRKIAFSPDGKRIAHTYFPDPAVHVVDLTSGEEVKTLTGHLGLVNAFAFSHDGKLLASASDDETVLVWELAR